MSAFRRLLQSFPSLVVRTLRTRGLRPIEWPDVVMTIW